MTELSPNNYDQQNSHSSLAVDELRPTDENGVEESDVRVDSVAEQILGSNLEKFRPYVGAAHDFVKDKLGMVDVSDVSRAAVLPLEVARQWGVKSVGGNYLPELDLVYVFETSDSRPKTAKIGLASGLVHEFAHSASVTPEKAVEEHNFYHEAIAGLAEYFALQNLSSAGEFTQAPDCTVRREIDGEEVRVVIPGSFRRVDASEVNWASRYYSSINSCYGRRDGPQDYRQASNGYPCVD
jgi:hypothetical protein